MHAHAQLAIARVAEPDGQQHSRISRLRSDGPLMLRPTIAAGVLPCRGWDLDGPGAAQVTRAAGAAGPLGGDDLNLDIDLEPGAALVLRDASATIALPGPHDRTSRTRTMIRIGAEATLVWLPEPVIAAHGCDHHSTTHVHLEPGARLLLREELLLGRHAEQPGTIRQRLRVTQGGQPLHDQELAAGPGVPGWRSAAVTGGRRASGSLLLVDPHRGQDPQAQPATAVDTDLAVLPLTGSAVLITALADDATVLRHRLDAALAAVEEPEAEPVPARELRGGCRRSARIRVRR